MKKFSLIKAITISIILFGYMAKPTAQKHVSPIGNDDNPGSLSSPWKTVSYAGKNARAGDTVYIHEGIYNDRLVIKNSGTKDNPIVFTNYQNDTVILTATRESLYDYSELDGNKRIWFGLIDMYHVSYIEIKGLVIKKANYSNGIYGQDAHDIVIENNLIDDCYNSGIGFLIDGVQYVTYDDGHIDQADPQDTALWTLNTNIIIRNNEVTHCNNGGWSEVISLEGVDGFEVSNNYIHHNHDGRKESYWGGGGENINCKRSTRNGKVFNNVIHDSRRLGIYVEAWDGYCFDIEVYNNTVYKCQFGVDIASEWNGKVSNIKVYNNIIHHTAYDGIILPKMNKKPAQIVKNIEIFNNTIVNPEGYGIVLKNPQATNVIIKNNLLVGGILGTSIADSSYVIDNNLVTETPKFYNDSVYNYRLTASSPAKDSAVESLVPVIDRDSNIRPLDNGYDIGAYEYNASYTPPALPTLIKEFIGKAISYSEIALNWQANTNNTNGYRVEKKAASETNFSLQSIKEEYEIRDTLKNLEPATIYEIRIKGFNDAGFGPISSLLITTDNPPKPAVPEGFAINVSSISEIKIWWKPVKYAGGYVIERQTSGSSFEFIDSLGADERAYKDTGVNPATTYTYRVYAYNVSGNSDYSTEIEGTTGNNTLVNEGMKNIVKIYPNPARNFVYIYNSHKDAATILSQLGEPLITESIGAGENIINIKSLKKGFYIIKLDKSGKVFKLLIE